MLKDEADVIRTNPVAGRTLHAGEILAQNGDHALARNQYAPDQREKSALAASTGTENEYPLRRANLEFADDQYVIARTVAETQPRYRDRILGGDGRARHGF